MILNMHLQLFIYMTNTTQHPDPPKNGVYGILRIKKKCKEVEKQQIKNKLLKLACGKRQKEEPLYSRVEEENQLIFNG